MPQIGRMLLIGQNRTKATLERNVKTVFPDTIGKSHTCLTKVVATIIGNLLLFWVVGFARVVVICLHFAHLLNATLEVNIAPHLEHFFISPPMIVYHSFGGCQVIFSCPSPAARHPLPVTRCPSPAARHPLPVTRCPLPAARCPLPAARCPLPAARCPLPAARCPLPAARCPLPDTIVSTNGVIPSVGVSTDCNDCRGQAGYRAPSRHDPDNRYNRHS
jgi:hypothetical protein